MVVILCVLGVTNMMEKVAAGINADEHGRIKTIQTQQWMEEYVATITERW